MTQQERIIQYIKENGSITSWEAIKELGCTRLAGQIFSLEKKGYRFDHHTQYAVNRYGEPTHFAMYTLVKEPEKDE